MRRLVLSLVALLALALVGSPVALAQEATPAASPAAADLAYPPDAEVEGATLAEWHGRWEQWFLSFPLPVHPGLDETGERCATGQHGPVFFLASSIVPEFDVARACTMPAGPALFVPLVSVGCSTVEPPPFFGRDEAELRACAASFLDGGGAIPQRLTVDGVDVPLEGYRTQTPLRRVALPPDNFLEAPPTVAGVVSDGYGVLLAPPPVGAHTVVIGVPGPGGTTATLTYELTVADAEIAAPQTGTPEAATPAT